MWAENVIHHVDDFSDPQFLGFFNQRVEVCPERRQDIFPLKTPARNVIQLLFKISGEVIFHVTAEEVGQECNHDPAPLSRDKSLLIQAHVFPVLQDGNDRRVRGRTTDAQLFHFLHQRRFGIAWWWRGKVLVCNDFFTVKHLTFFQPRQPLFSVIVARIIAAFLVDFDEAVEGQNRTGRAHLRSACVNININANLIKNSCCHLASDRPLPDQLVETHLVAIEDAFEFCGLA